MRAKVVLEDQDSTSKGHAHADACEDTLYEQQRPELVAPASGQD